MRTETVESLADVTAAAWDALVPARDPFLRHAFLWGLERHGCVGPATGWIPRHVLCRDPTGRLIGAAPLYLKTNGYGEFVFDWGWAEAYRRSALAYYPKLVGAIPFTPVTGPRLLLERPGDTAVAGALIDHALADAGEIGASSVHWLFPADDDLQALVDRGLHHRLGCQFHWHNPGYRDFQDFLDTLTARRRKSIRRERRRVRETGLEIEVLPGERVDEARWQDLHRFYRSTFQRLGGVPTLSLAFFRALARAPGSGLVVVIARERGRDVAAALSFAGADTLYGRHWGCDRHYDALHFEACYYQGIEYCIARGLTRFEPGAQGEHKVMRGFLPTLTHSAHWLAHAGFDQAVADFLARERPAVREYAGALREHSPYREAH